MFLGVCVGIYERNDHNVGYKSKGGLLEVEIPSCRHNLKNPHVFILVISLLMWLSVVGSLRLIIN